MRSENPADQSLLRLEDTLKELEIVLGESARPVVGEVRQLLSQAIASRQAGDSARMIDHIRAAMERLAQLAGQLDRDEGALMRAVAGRFAAALAAGDKGAAKQAVGVMRGKAGAAEGDDDSDW